MVKAIQSEVDGCAELEGVHTEEWDIWQLALGTPVEKVFSACFTFAANPLSAQSEPLMEAWPVHVDHRGLVNCLISWILEASVVAPAFGGIPALDQLQAD